MGNNETGETLRPSVCIITGGGSGMGLATAKLMGESYYVVICGRSVDKLEGAIKELKMMQVECEAFPCDVSDINSVRQLVQHVSKIGKIQAVIHAAGLSPHMGDAKSILRTNALGTIQINTEFSKVMTMGSCIVDVSSMAAHLAPQMIMPTGIYKYSITDSALFIKKFVRRVNIFPKKFRSGAAYAMSKHFDVWYAKKCAGLYGSKGIRVISVCPGNFETPMGEIEKDEADKFKQRAAIKRFGYPEEIAYLFRSCVDEKNSYLTGTDIVCDGGVVAECVKAI